MKMYDKMCPICGTINHNLYLQETDGWMECEHCKSVVQVMHMTTKQLIPLFTLNQLTKIVAEAH